jgi:hypothetical protein|tara:strand:- start:4689 stop:4958 length:270 start_codon:yes stop_codon:yes gene_type:complete
MEPTHHIFGQTRLKDIKKGDLVRWHTLIKEEGPGYKENVGIVTNVHIEHRGGRDVAMAKIIPLGSQSGAGNEIEVFLSCLKVISSSVIE